MSKRHNRKRTRSRPRFRDANKANANHIRTPSMDTNASFSSNSSFQHSYHPIANRSTEHWHQTYSAWQSRIRYEQEQAQALEAQQLQLRIFGGEPKDEVSLFEPMLRVVTDLFDGNIDYEDP